MKKTQTLSTGFIALMMFVLIGAGCTSNSPQNNTAAPQENGEKMMEKQEDAMMEKENDTMMQDDAMMENETDDGSMMKDEKEEGSMMEGESMEKAMPAGSQEDTAMMQARVGSYEAYAPKKLAMAENGDVVLFFHAPWCPTCKALDSNVKANEEKIPDGVTILKTDYDSQTELKRKYGVTYQHTFVQVDKDGNMIKKWSGGNTLEDVLVEVE